MILVLLGTNPYSFTRLVIEIDNIAYRTNKEIIIQLGNTNYLPKYASYFNFAEREKILDYIEEAELIISQGGCGSLYDCLQKGKKVVAVPRLKELGEAPDDQTELVKHLEKEGKVIGVYDINKLEEALDKAKELIYQPTFSNKISKIIENYIDTILKD